MSTDYRLLRKVPACDLFDGRLEEFGVRERVKPRRNDRKEQTANGRLQLPVGLH